MKKTNSLKENKYIESHVFSFIIRKFYKIYPVANGKYWDIEIDLFGFINNEKIKISNSEIQKQLVLIYNREYSIYSKVIEFDSILINNNIYVFYEKLKNNSYKIIVKNKKTGEIKKFNKILENFEDLKNAIEKTIKYYHEKIKTDGID